MALTLLGAPPDVASRIAAADDIGGLYGPGQRLEFHWPTPDGGAYLFFGWTAGAAEFGEQIDREAKARRLTVADLTAAISPHVTRHQHGHATVNAAALAPVLASVRTDLRASRAWRRVARAQIPDADERANPGWRLSLGPTWTELWCARTNELIAEAVAAAEAEGR
ncbi:hypothetical protein [Pseudofrankia sp. BMG5.37]|uniref:hypothetical protein n=1 Tax=Pseudofrankia sp. BMG5.37 TaxID=3050035 RepID=UPI002893EC11|nr:hypothetical protein [Pseudofrankia sp. BMG5.37]MDT3438345.1 hypothetical protein [Pseudofrankia sp. BMG5.37]